MQLPPMAPPKKSTTHTDRQRFLPTLENSVKKSHKFENSTIANNRMNGAANLVERDV
jgi:hypothetical protein